MAIFNKTLSNEEVYNIYKRSNVLKLNITLTGYADADCIYAVSSQNISLPTANISLPSAKYFKYSLKFYTSNNSESPKVYNVSFEYYALTEYYCGDRICNATETCTNCPTDCGQCMMFSSEVKSELTEPNIKIETTPMLPGGATGELKQFDLGEALKKVNIAFGNNSMEIRVNDLYSFLGFRKDGRFSFVFELSPKIYAAHCYNRYLDADETNLDCGGECAPCIEIPGSLGKTLGDYLWILELILVFAIITTTFIGRKNKIIAELAEELPAFRIMKIEPQEISPLVETKSAKVKVKKTKIKAKKIKFERGLDEINKGLGIFKADMNKFSRKLKKF